jgi:hypothetical protein
MERCTLIRFSVSPGFPPMPMNDALDDCQTHAGSVEFCDTVQTLKYAEELVCVLHVETSAVIMDREPNFVSDSLPRDVDPRLTCDPPAKAELSHADYTKILKLPGDFNCLIQFM